jgi:hypothetical protein
MRVIAKCSSEEVQQISEEGKKVQPSAKEEINNKMAGRNVCFPHETTKEHKFSLHFGVSCGA